jgi:DnaJ-class molecular chaperone
MTPMADCEACGAQGTLRHRCTGCDGSGTAAARRYRCRVQVPAGTHAGSVLHVTARVQGQRRKQDVALRVRVELQPHAVFTLDADGTVRCELPVDGFAWTANRWIEVPTPRGLQQMRLMRGYLAYRIKGAGLAGSDCMVTVAPVFPEELNGAQEAAIDRLIAGNTAAAQRIAAWNRKAGRNRAE